MAVALLAYFPAAATVAMFSRASSKLGCTRAKRSDNVLDRGRTLKPARTFLETRPPGRSLTHPKEGKVQFCRSV